MNNKEIKKLEYGYTDYETERNLYEKINEIIQRFNHIESRVNELITISNNNSYILSLNPSNIKYK